MNLIMLPDITLQVAQIVPHTEAEGPGRRFALWFQGCPLRCAGCCNPEMLPFEGGRAIPLNVLVGQIEEAARSHGVEGITLWAANRWPTPPARPPWRGQCGSAG
jgi:anaerobic ribonucleoside-triphosphate reductase activating protein